MSFNSWTNPYRYDGRDGVRYDGETGLYWMSVRAYDPALGRFLSRDPLGHVPLFFADQPYAYAGNNPLINVGPSGQFMATEGMSHAQVRQARAAANKKYVKWFRMQPVMKSVIVDGQTCYDRECVRHANTEELSRAAGRWAAIGTLIQIAALFIDWRSEGTIGKLEIVTSIAIAGIQFIGYVMQAIGGTGPIYEMGQRIAAGLNWVAHIALQARAIYKTWGWFAQDAIEALAFAIEGTVGGLPGTFESLAMKVFGRALALALSGSALYFFGQYNAINAEYAHEQNMPISNWCAQYGGGACSGLL